MPPKRTRTYWDACAFLSYINSIPDRLPTLDALLEESAYPEKEREIVTSAFTIAEVAFVLKEKKQKALDPQAERDIDALWSDRYAVKLVDLHEGIATGARTLIREAVTDGLSLKPAMPSTSQPPKRSAAKISTRTRKTCRGFRA